MFLWDFTGDVATFKGNSITVLQHPRVTSVLNKLF